MPENDEVLVFDTDEAVEFIQEGLLKQGFAVEKDAILLVMELEEAYMRMKGIIVDDEE